MILTYLLAFAQAAAAPAPAAAIPPAESTARAVKSAGRFWSECVLDWARQRGVPAIEVLERCSRQEAQFKAALTAEAPFSGATPQAVEERVVKNRASITRQVDAIIVGEKQ